MKRIFLILLFTISIYGNMTADGTAAAQISLQHKKHGGPRTDDPVVEPEAFIDYFERVIIIDGGDVTLRNNMSRNLKHLARVAAGNGISKFKLNATGNTFHGDTKIYCDVIDTLNIDFRKNLFISNNMTFFLQEFATTGSLVFNENNVFVETNGGKLMAHWNSNPTSSMRFNRLEVRNNLLRGINSTENMLKYITNVGDSIVSGNICIQNL